ncbi:hypothetical protein GlitD10_0425 [Gloeomargarita lithophora Alchichica-D10]|uniref:N-acetyltransferase domain-containing protein n=1 Tax=Gloeomargarita lithophora Alchichica-D10 TaxID=1188229 RepID=A0A1J0A9X1_9CYAN|nr:hypothetical protein [Gloeomargarita lithophora]APB32736.1 hypothetical protein GlitD10_0425 [Gloeomargarita lithophora Alchichica-D10]
MEPLIHPIVRPVKDESEMEAVYRITHDAFVAGGYCDPQPNGLLIYNAHLDAIPETTVLVAVYEEEIIGTISWTLDSPHGLHVDDDFQAECDLIRLEGKRLAGSWRIATQKRYQNQRPLVLSLIQGVVDDYLDYGIDTSVFIFDPSHERVYQKLLGMRTVARRDAYTLTNTPVVLMRVEIAELPDRWLRNRTTELKR